MPGKRSPEAIAKFKKTMAAKKAAGWHPKPAKKRSKHLPAQMSIPLDAIPERPAKKPPNVRVRQEKVIDGLVLSRIEDGDKTVLALETALALEIVRLLQTILK